MPQEALEVPRKETIAIPSIGPLPPELQVNSRPPSTPVGLRLPDSKEGPDKVLLVSEQTLAYLHEIRDRSGGSTYVCPNEDGQQQQNIQSIWRRVRKAAGLEDVNLHALRHSFISDAVTAGVPLFIAGRMAGHKSPQTTQRYAHLEDEALRRALATTGRAIAERSQPREGATVLQLPVAKSAAREV